MVFLILILFVCLVLQFVASITTSLFRTPSRCWIPRYWGKIFTVLGPSASKWLHAEWGKATHDLADVNSLDFLPVLYRRKTKT